MSHIDNALEKAQKERDSTYKRYSHIIPVEPHKHTNRKVRWVAVAAAVIVGFSAALVLLSFHGTPPLEKKNPAIQHKDAVAQEGVTFPHKTSSEAPAILPPPERDEEGKPPSPAMPGDTNIAQQGSDVTHRADPSGADAYRNSNMNTHTGDGSNATGKTAQEQTPAEGIDTLYKRALGYQKKGEFERAEEGYKNILRIEPGHVFSLNNLGVIYMVRGRSQDAAQMFERSIKTKGDYVNPYYNLACLYSQKEDIPRALDYLERAMLINNDVKNWAKNDRDLDRLRQSAGYARVMGEGAASPEISSPVYVVCEGDRIFDVIRREFGSSGKEAYTILELIKQLNPMMEDSNMVYPGWRLKLPGKEAVEGAISSHVTPQKENEPLSNIQPHD